MQSPSRMTARRPWPSAGVRAAAAFAALAFGVASVLAQTAPPGPIIAPSTARTATVGAPVPARAGPAEDGVRWQKLRPAQRESLKPLQQEWAGIDAQRKQKWLELADRMPAMPTDERARVQERMTDWARLTPIQRGQARLLFQEARQVPPSDRRSRWEAYQTLPQEQKSALAARAAAGGSPAPVDETARRAAESGRTARAERLARDASQPKSNIIPNPTFTAPPKPVAPTVVQAGPGATTTLITRRPAPPAHQQTGLPKIAATPDFVNKSTLLPQRGPQGAAIRAVPPGDAASAARR